ncbi:hypothetical protein LTS08_001549 [Lithohypha guttulata]|uniref:Altered inheritance of mitochondria protein 41 n=1 Tax=Lithohypha guttulata TaxID=1690604 RepID=A0AAN7YDR5_9EURO|nr:hypothetical protein LTR51_003783 [Lithohypha guttulata]KAK5082286.1 hypothetical protein LTR05_007432 [Lithohypha guttulata]KAK5105274.1 hypothetical protein LTS08_001549 [Lithohypha guttulata]
MASLRTGVAQTALRETRRTPYVCPQCELRQMRLSPFNDLPRRKQIRYSSTDAAAPPLLAKIKGDLKTAMRAKDTPRLNVLRAMITEYNNASKTNTPIKTDIQLLALLKKKKAASEAAASEAKAANRQDLEEKNMQEIKVIDELAGEVKLVPDQEIQETVSKVLESLKQAASGADVKAGNVLKELLKAGGPFNGRPVDNAQVSKIVNQLLTGGK